MSYYTKYRIRVAGMSRVLVCMAALSAASFAEAKGNSSKSSKSAHTLNAGRIKSAGKAMALKRSQAKAGNKALVVKAFPIPKSKK